MTESIIDGLFDDTASGDLPMPGTELDFFLDQLPVDDTSTFIVKDVSSNNSEKDLWEFDSDIGDTSMKRELLSDGGSPDSSSPDRYTLSEEEEDHKALLNVDIFLNKPRAASDNDVMVNIPQRGSAGYPPVSRSTYRGRINTDDIRCGNVKGRDVTEDERKMLLEEGVTIPYNAILTKNEERALKKVRRKIKNKISAAESRKRRKEYIGGLERRVEDHTVVNVKLQNTIDELQKRNRNLMEQLKRAAYTAKKLTVGSQTTTTCIMGLLLSFTFFIFPLFSSPFQTTSTQATSNYIPGRSLLSISDTPKASFIELLVDYIVEKIDDMDFYRTSPEMLILQNDSVFLT